MKEIYKQNVQYVLNTFEEYKKNVKSVINVFIDNEKIDLKERVEIFWKACNLGIYPIDDYYHYFDGVDWNTKSLYDDFNIDKYATFHFDYLADIYLGNVEDDCYEDIEASVKYFMKKRIAGFINDW